MNDSGISLMGLLGLLFIALKLTKVINWSWWLVLLPWYGGVLIALAIGLGCYLLGHGLGWWLKRDRKKLGGDAKSV